MKDAKRLAIPVTHAQCPECWFVLMLIDTPAPVGDPARGWVYRWNVACPCGWTGAHEIVRHG